MSSRKTLDIDLLTLRKVYPVGPTNRPQPANTVFTVNSAGEGTWVNPIDNLTANGINPPLPTQLSNMQTDIANLNEAVFGGIDPHAEFVTKTEFLSTLVNPLPETVLAPKGVIAGPDPSSNMLGIISKSGLSLQNSGFNYWIATEGSDPFKQILSTADFVTFTGQSGFDFNTAPSGILPQCYTVETNGSIWVAGGTSNNNGPVKPILFSVDGINWSGVTWNGGTMQSACYTIKYNGSVWVAVGGAGLSNPIYYSVDGITWSPSTGSTASSPFATIKALDYSNGEWYAIGDDSRLYTSTNGMSWAKDNTSIPNISNTTYALCVYSIPSKGGIYTINNVETIILIANSKALYKYNIAENTVSSLIPNFSCYAVETNGLMWIAVGKGVDGNTNKLYYTSDITASSGWTAMPGVSFTTGTYVTWTGSEWLCTGNDASGNNYVYNSINGISWTLKKKFANNEQGVEVINQILTVAPAVYVAPGQQRVGVFTTEPNAALDIEGDVIVRNNITVQNTLTVNTNLDVNTIYTNNINSRTNGDINMNSVTLNNLTATAYGNTTNSYYTGVKTTGEFAISYGPSDVLVFDGSGGIFSNIAIAFNNPMTKDLQGRIATDSDNTGRLFAEAINTFLVTDMDAVHTSAQFNVSGTMPSITFFDPTTITNNLTVTETLDASNINVTDTFNAAYASIPVLDTINAHLTGTLDVSNINVTDTLNAAYASIPVLDVDNAHLTGTLNAATINVSNDLSANNITAVTCSINAGPSSSNTTLRLEQADPFKYWQLYVTSSPGGGLTPGNFSLWSYDNNRGFIGKAIDIDASCSSVTLCNDDVSGNVYVNGPSGLGRVYDSIYNPPPVTRSGPSGIGTFYDTVYNPPPSHGIINKIYTTSGIYHIPANGTYTVELQVVGGGGGGSPAVHPTTQYTMFNNPNAITGCGGGSGYVKIYKFTLDITNSISFTINIGAGGAGGVGTYDSISNSLSGSGSIGGNTHITLNNYTFTAQGGTGGSTTSGGNGSYGGFGGQSATLVLNNTQITVDGYIINPTPLTSGTGDMATIISDGTGNGGGTGILLYGKGGSGGNATGSDLSSAQVVNGQNGEDGYASITLIPMMN